MTRYLSISPLQEPFELSPDDSGRAMWACNFVLFKRPSESFLRELIGILVDAGVGVENVSIFAGSLAVLPDPNEFAGPVLQLKATGGVPPVGTLNDGAGAYRRPGVEIFAHASTTPAAEAMAQAAYNALISVRNQPVSPVVTLSTDASFGDLSIVGLTLQIQDAGAVRGSTVTVTIDGEPTALKEGTAWSSLIGVGPASISLAAAIDALTGVSASVGQDGQTVTVVPD